MELSGYLAVARRWWWTLLVATWVAAVSGYVFASQIPPTYESQVQLLVGPYNTDTETLRAAGQLVQTYAELVTTQPLLESAVAETGADIEPSALGANTRVIANDTTRFLTIRVQDTDPEQARDLANALGNEIILLASRGVARPEGQLQVVDFATAPESPVAPQVSLIVGMAAIAALLGAMVLVMLVEYLSATVRTKEDLTRLTRLPFLGHLDTLRMLPGAGGLVDRAPESAVAAAYRLVATKAAVRERDEPARSVVVVGTGPDAANAQVAANLAAVTARGGRQVILVDADPTDASVSRIFELHDRPGLTESLAGPDSDPGTNMYRVSRTLRVIPSGVAGELDAIDVEAAASILERLGGIADHVIVSTGPLHTSAGALVWARAGDSVLLVAVRDQSRRDDVAYAVESLRLVGVETAGAVLADRRRSLGRSLPSTSGRTVITAEPASTQPIKTEPPVVRTQRTTRRRGSAGETAS